MISTRTIVGALVAAYAVPWAARHGIALDAEQQVWVVGGIVALLATTHMDVRALKAAWLARLQGQGKPQQVVVIGISPEVRDGLAEAVSIAVAKRFRPKQTNPNPTQPANPANLTGVKI